MSKIGQNISGFFKNLFEGAGSKRIVGFGCFLLLASQVIVNEASGHLIQEALIWANVGVIGACFGFNALIDMKAIGAKSQVASDIAKEQPDSETANDAKDVMNSNKP